jgi:hypothetical protein
VIPDFGDVEPLEDSLPDDAIVVEEGTNVPTMDELPVPDGFVPAEPIDLDELGPDPDPPD